MSLFVFCFVQYLTILFGCTGVRWLDATCTDSFRQSHGFRQCDLATSRVLLPRGVSPTCPPLLTSVHSLKGRVGGISPGARAVPSSRRAQPFAPLAASLAASLFLGFGDAVLAARAAQAPCALSPVLALLPRPAALPPAAAFLPLGLVTGPGAHAKTGRTASSSGFLAPRAS